MEGGELRRCGLWRERGWGAGAGAASIVLPRRQGGAATSDSHPPHAARVLHWSRVLCDL